MLKYGIYRTLILISNRTKMASYLHAAAKRFHKNKPSRVFTSTGSWSFDRSLSFRIGVRFGVLPWFLPGVEFILKQAFNIGLFLFNLPKLKVRWKFWRVWKLTNQTVYFMLGTRNYNGRLIKKWRHNISRYFYYIYLLFIYLSIYMYHRFLIICC